MSIPCDYFRRLSFDTWRRINLARRGGFKIYETTITQNILYHLYFFRRRHSANILLFESTDERTNGDDLEIILNTRNGYIKLPTQAKLLYASNKYQSLKHTNQLHELVAYANSPQVGGIPLYLFYNFYDSAFPFPHDLCSIAVRPEDYGCSICSAITLKNKFAYPSLGVDTKGHQNWIIPTFLDLHTDFCDPFWILTCCHRASDDVANVLRILKLTTPVSDIKTFSLEELSSEKNWIPLDLESSEELISHEKQTSEIREGFNPRFRIVINNTSGSGH
jgi:hypothetical protein